MIHQETDADPTRAANLKLVSLRTVCDLTSLSRATIYRLVDEEKFPKGLKITANRIAVGLVGLLVGVSYRGNMRPAANL